MQYTFDGVKSSFSSNIEFHSLTTVRCESTRKCSWGGYGCETNPWDLETLKRQIQTQAIGGCSSGQVHTEPRDSQWYSKGAFGAQVPRRDGPVGITKQSEATQ